MLTLIPTDQLIYFIINQLLIEMQLKLEVLLMMKNVLEVV